MVGNEGIELADKINVFVFQAMKRAQDVVIPLVAGNLQREAVAKYCSEVNTNATKQIIEAVIAFLDSKPTVEAATKPSDN